LVDDLILLGVRAGANQEALNYLDIVDKKRGSVPPCAADETFLCRLLQVDSLDTSKSDEVVRKVEEALALRHSSTMELMGLFENTIDTQKTKAESISQSLHAVKSTEGWLVCQLSIHFNLTAIENSHSFIFRCHHPVI
jgi:E3 ubiquitin-protein ligase BRE1